MSVLADTNILLRGAQPAHPHCPLATHAVSQLLRQKQAVYYCSQTPGMLASVTSPLGLTPNRYIRNRAGSVSAPQIRLHGITRHLNSLPNRRAFVRHRSTLWQELEKNSSEWAAKTVCATLASKSCTKAKSCP